MPWGTIIQFVIGLLSKLLGIGSSAPSVEATAEATGEDAGKAKAQRDEATSAVREIQKAQDARGAADAALPVDDGVRSNTDGHASPRGADGVS